MEAVEERICDQPVLRLLRAGVLEDGQVRREVAGTPQGSVASPVMCNVCLHRLDRAWDERDGVLCRYADDLVVMCWSRSQAEAALERLTVLLATLGLELKAAKARIVHLEEGGGGVDFPGFHHRLVRSRGLHGKKPVMFLARWPADKAMQHARDRIRELTGHRRLLLPPEAIVQDVNAFLLGWTGYFRYGHSARGLSKIRQYARMHLPRAAHQQEASPQPQLRLARDAQRHAARAWPGQLVRNHRPSQGRKALAGEAECRR